MQLGNKLLVHSVQYQSDFVDLLFVVGRAVHQSSSRKECLTSQLALYAKNPCPSKGWLFLLRSSGRLGTANLYP